VKNFPDILPKTMNFVTGASGMVGSRLVVELLKNPSERIIALKRPETNVEFLKNLIQKSFPDFQQQFHRINWVDGSLLDYDFLDSVIPTNSKVYHLAAMVSFNKKDKEVLYETNVNGTANLVNVCLQKGIEKMCYVSSIAALGRNEQDGLVTETDYRTQAKGTSYYSTTKYEAEMEVWRGIAEGLPAVIVNPSVIIGSSNWESGSSQLITTVFKGLKFYTKGINGYVDAEDVAKIMVRLMDSTVLGERFILSAENLSYQTLFQIIAKKLNVDGPKIYAAPWMGAIAWRVLALLSLFTGKKPMITKDTARNARSVFRYDSSKIKNLLDYNFMPIETAIERAVEDFKESEIYQSKSKR